MFDIGFSEIVLIFVVALIVVGPERLPRVARAAGLWFGRMRGFVSQVKADIDRELAAEDLKRALQKQTQIPEMQKILDETRDTLQNAKGQFQAATREYQVKAVPDAAPAVTPEPAAKPAGATPPSSEKAADERD